ncbi:MAG: flagellar basal body rod protein FlgC [Burkholderiaceae bacterium]
MSLIRSFEIGSTALVAQALRLNTTASNIANAETTEGPDGRPYRSRQVEFKTIPFGDAPGQGVQVANIIESDAPFRMEFKPGHPKANEAGFVEMPTVNPVEEMVNMISAARSYQMNIEMMNTTRILMLRTLNLGKN